MPLTINKNKRNKIAIAALLTVILAALSAILIRYTTLNNIIKFELGNKAGFTVSLKNASPEISKIAADSEISITLKAFATDSSGKPVPSARINFYEKDGLGQIKSLAKRTSVSGAITLVYSPPDEADALQNTASRQLEIFAEIPGSQSKDSIKLQLIRVPVVFVHGYKTSPTIFTSFADYLKNEGFMTSSVNYKSEKGVASSASELSKYLAALSIKLAEKNFLCNRFDIIAHSMGGLVVRYYTCGESYYKTNNVSKIIFLSTPQAGSPFASLGLKYYNDRGIQDLLPESDLYSKTFTSMVNKGLNSRIRTASILGQYDEVVSPESASLEKWGIKTEIYNVGENNFTMNNLLTGKIVEAANHKLVLYNLKVYQRVRQLLLSDMPYPKRAE